MATQLQSLSPALKGACEQNATCVQLTFAGFLDDDETTSLFKQFIANHCAGNNLPLLIDIRLIDYLAMNGAAAAVEVAKSCNSSERAYAFVAKSQDIQRFKLMGLAALMHLHAELDAALASLPVS